MAGPLPEGAPWPADHKLDFGPPARTFHAYVHIPFCDVRCGYCDFNTYTASEIGDVKRSDFHDSLISEIRFSKRMLQENDYISKPLKSIFFGGGTPTLFSANQFLEIISELSDSFGIEENAEITTEANPDNVDLEYLASLRSAGVNRISFGVQSFDSKVLKTLDRTHDPERVPQVVRWANQVGLRVSVDLIYGTPGESLSSWQETVSRALNLGAEHISAYSLIVEPGTKLERKIRAGEIAPVDDDQLAEKYEYASNAFESAGLDWYEISNWGRPSVHNQAYWQSMDWWGYGPGAHSHVSGNRWWNKKHPVAYRSAAQSGSPAHAFEQISPVARAQERLLLELRTLEGVSKEVIRELGIPAAKVAEFIGRGLIEQKSLDRIGVTRTGRLLADGIVLELLNAAEV